MLPCIEDFDGDGFLDGVVAYGDSVGIVWGDAAGCFSAIDVLPPISPRLGIAWRVTAGDVTGDGLIDLVCSYFPQSSAAPVACPVFVQTGHRAFTMDHGSRMPLLAWRLTHAVALLDIDRDGDLDALLAVYSGQDLVLENDGAGFFSDSTATRITANQNRSWGFQVIDLDGDGWDDVVVATGGSVHAQNFIYWNDRGVLRDTSLQGPAFPTNQMDVGDLDGDGHLDLVFGNEWAPPEVYWGLGNRGFLEDVSMLPPSALSHALAGARLVDFDLDGDLDLLQSGSQADCLLENLGSRRFADVTASIEPLLTTGFVVADFDRDGDQDLLHRIGSSSHTRLSVGMFRQTHAPRAASLGSTLTLELHARPGRFALLSVAPALRVVDLGAYGVWQLDVPSSVQFPAVTLPANGRHDIVLQVPNDPALRGVDLHWQSLEIDPGAINAVRVGNRATTRFQ